MASLSLFFYSGAAAQLESVEYSSGTGAKHRATRGTSLGQGQGSFPWTAGVKALSLLAVGTKIQSLRAPHEGDFSLEGGRGSLAAALDSALSKNPLWLLDMFGVDAQGGSTARRIFKRVNPERKRPGPVKISLSRNALPAASITIVIDGEPTQSVEDLELLESSLLQTHEPHTKTSTNVCASFTPIPVASEGSAARFPKLQARLEYLRSLGPLPKPFSSDQWLPSVLDKLTLDISTALRSMDIFTLAGQAHFIKLINQNTLYKKLTKKPFNPYHTVQNQPDFLRLGVAPDPVGLAQDLGGDSPIHVFHPTGPYAAPLIFDYLRYVKEYNFATHGQYYCGTHLVADLLEARVSPVPDALILGMDAAGFLLSSQSGSDYLPFMILPLSPHIILAPRSHNEHVQSSGDYILQKDPYDCCKAYFRSATDVSFVNKRKIATHNVTPDSAFQLLREGKEKLRLPTGLEYFRLIEPFHDCHVTKEPFLMTEGSEVVLVVHRRLLTRDRAIHLELAIRDAWLSLSEDPGIIRALLEQQLLDHSFLKSVKRFSGLYDISTIIEGLTTVFELPGQTGITPLKKAS
jgi:hypothetical protein